MRIDAQEEVVSADGQSLEMCIENLLPNSSFEDGIRGWYVAHGPEACVSIDEGAGYTGNTSLRLDAPPAPERVMLYSIRLPVSPWERYRLHFFHRSARPPIGPLWRVYPTNADGSQTQGRAQWTACDGTAEWTGYYCDYVFPSDVSDVYLTFIGGYWGEECDRAATYWIDDIEFGLAKELDLGEASAPTADSLIFNGGFELGYGHEPFGWPARLACGQHVLWTGFRGLTHSRGPDFAITWETHDAYLGEKCVCIQYTGPDAKRQILLTQTLYPEEGTEYDIRFFAKAEGAQGRIVFEPYDAKNRWVCTLCGATVRGDEWREYRIRYAPDERVPPLCGVRMAILLRGPGKLWVDGLDMVPAGTGFGKATPSEPNDADAERHFQRGVELKGAGRHTEAARELRAALQADPRHLEAHWVLAWVLIELKDPAGAAGEFRKVIEIAPGSDRAKQAQRALERLRK